MAASGNRQSTVKIISKNLRFLIFSTAGAATYLVYAIITRLFIELFGIDYRIALTIAYVIAAGFQYSVHRGLVFREQKTTIHFSLPKYLVLLAINYLIQLITVTALSVYFGIDVSLAQIAGIALALLINYNLSKHWVFRT